jgi:hypothetical protein
VHVPFNLFNKILISNSDRIEGAALRQEVIKRQCPSQDEWSSDWSLKKYSLRKLYVTKTPVEQFFVDNAGGVLMTIQDYRAA